MKEVITITKWSHLELQESLHFAGRRREQHHESPGERGLTCRLKIDNGRGNVSVILMLPLQSAAFLYAYYII